ncbi:XRE family transcriptional regulator [Burkholderia sp. PAMC 28687]|uniref:XRE family transcriptional regulator n=1 Tax=Burkholderia sp. PAMC 28687 TaxID=1795874 RepID=UPI001560EA14|nr:S24 family peptidase [Burkholderia sp. PAMC 28687]
MSSIIREKRKGLGLTLQQIGDVFGISRGAVASWERGDTRPDQSKLDALARTLKTSVDYLLTGEARFDEPRRPYRAVEHRNESKNSFTLESSENTERATGEIPYWEARGSCGGGFLNYEEQPKGTLVKEATFFRKYDLRPENAVAIYADGDSMADFIVDGDIVIFDTSKTTPESGKIFLLHHPDGLRIKQLNRSIDGSWILQSRNPNKQAYPDERIGLDQAELLKIQGRFVYRQGGEQ